MFRIFDDSARPRAFGNLAAVDDVDGHHSLSFKMLADWHGERSMSAADEWKIAGQLGQMDGRTVKPLVSDL